MFITIFTHVFSLALLILRLRQICYVLQLVFMNVLIRSRIDMSRKQKEKNVFSCSYLVSRLVIPLVQSLHHPVSEKANLGFSGDFANKRKKKSVKMTSLKRKSQIGRTSLIP